ncbi:hypothetical protein, partial [Priestia megaterium]|uniref:hypothetical protein n=1 Tax=Priestia megaterium TaxID=1404 RepID=UPI0035B57870
QNRSAEFVETLRSAVRLRPDRDDVRTELAKAIVVHGGANADLSEVEGLLQQGNHSVAQSQFLYAALLSVRGGEKEVQQALEIARELSGGQQITE